MRTFADEITTQVGVAAPLVPSALVQPLVLSPKVWMCMPRSALASLPVTFQEIWVSADSEACSKVTVPLTLESPRITATRKVKSC